jgi:hypothetical protein
MDVQTGGRQILIRAPETLRIQLRLPQNRLQWLSDRLPRSRLTMRGFFASTLSISNAIGENSSLTVAAFHSAQPVSPGSNPGSPACTPLSINNLCKSALLFRQHVPADSGRQCSLREFLLSDHFRP